MTSLDPCVSERFMAHRPSATRGLEGGGGQPAPTGEVLSSDVYFSDHLSLEKKFCFVTCVLLLVVYWRFLDCKEKGEAEVDLYRQFRFFLTIMWMETPACRAFLFKGPLSSFVKTDHFQVRPSLQGFFRSFG